MSIVIVTGVSGAGKSRAVNALEDIGFYCVDNMPPALIPKFAELCLQTGGKIQNVAIVTDVRGGTLFNSLFDGLEELRKQGAPAFQARQHHRRGAFVRKRDFASGPRACGLHH